MFAHDGSEIVPRVSRTIASKKSMITIFYTGNRLIKLAHLPGRQKYNKEYFINAILEGINEECNHGVGYGHTKHMKIHMDNCRVQNAQQTTEKIRSMNLQRLDHPAYSPDLNPCDFWFFGRAKTAIQNQSFQDPDELIEALTNLFDSITFEELQIVFHNWIRRLRWVIENKGEYFHE
jgi:histone-lysine N-methyltransferase SETMAR